MGSGARLAQRTVWTDSAFFRGSGPQPSVCHSVLSLTLHEVQPLHSSGGGSRGVPAGWATLRVPHSDGPLSGCPTLFKVWCHRFSHMCPSETKAWGCLMRCSMPHIWSPGLDENSGLLTLFVKLRCSQNHLYEKMISQNGTEEPRERGIFFFWATEGMGSGPGKSLLQHMRSPLQHFPRHSIPAINLCRQACLPSRAHICLPSHDRVHHHIQPHSLGALEDALLCDVSTAGHNFPRTFSDNDCLDPSKDCEEG